MAIETEGKSPARRPWTLDVVVLLLAACVLAPAVVALQAIPWARGMLVWALPAATATGFAVGLALVALPVHRRWWLVLLGTAPLLATATGLGALVTTTGAGAAQTGFGTILLGGYSAILGAATPWLTLRAKQVWLTILAAWITVAGAWGAHLSTQQVWWLVWLLAMSVVVLGMTHLREEKRLWDADGLQRLGPVLWPAARTITGVSVLVAVLGLLPLGAGQLAALSSLWNKTPAGRTGPLSYSSAHGTPVAVLGAPLSLGAPDVTSDRIVLAYNVLEGPVTTPPLLGATLDSFDGSNWTQGPTPAPTAVRGPLGTPNGAQDLKVRVTVYSLPASQHGSFLLGFDQPLSFSVPAQVRLLDGTTPTAVAIASWETAQPLGAGVTYTAQSAILTGDSGPQGTLPAALQRRMTQLPHPIDAAALAAARAWVGDASTPLARAQALLAGLTKAVSYDANATPPAGDDVVTWTLQHQRGNTLVLSTTYILLGRALGLPLRLAEGYLPGTFDAQLKQMVVRGSDATVWAQLAIPGEGWFDLFPAANELIISVPNKIIYAGAPTPTPSPTPPEAKPGDANSRQQSAQRHASYSDTASSGGYGWLMPALAVLVGLLLVAAALGFVRWKWSRYGAHLAPLGQFFARVGLLARLGGIALRPSDTATQATGKVATVIPGHSEALVSLNSAYEHTRYGPSTGRAALPNLRDQWRRLRGALVRLMLTRPWRRARPRA